MRKFVLNYCGNVASSGIYGIALPPSFILFRLDPAIGSIIPCYSFDDDNRTSLYRHVV